MKYHIDAWSGAWRVHVVVGRQELTLSVEDATALLRKLEPAVREAVESEARTRARFVAQRGGK